MAALLGESGTILNENIFVFFKFLELGEQHEICTHLWHSLNEDSLRRAYLARPRRAVRFDSESTPMLTPPVGFESSPQFSPSQHSQ